MGVRQGEIERSNGTRSSKFFHSLALFCCCSFRAAPRIVVVAVDLLQPNR